MKKPHQPEPPPERSGVPSKTRKLPGPPAELKEILAPAAQSGVTPRTFRIASLAIAAGAALIPAGLKYFKEMKASETPVSVQELVTVHTIKFLESGVIRSKPLRAERSGFKKSFSNGNTEFPAYKVERSYAVYDPVGERFLGTLTVPDSSCTDPIVIELDLPSAFWKPAMKAAGTAPNNLWSECTSGRRFQKSDCLPSSAEPILVEHHMAVAAEADWILDLGPEAGDAGGEIIAQGPPELVAKSKKSRTAPFLAAALES